MLRNQLPAQVVKEQGTNSHLQKYRHSLTLQQPTIE